MSHLLLVSLFTELNLLIFFTGGKFIVLDFCSKKEGNASGITGGNLVLFFSALPLQNC